MNYDEETLPDFERGGADGPDAESAISIAVVSAIGGAMQEQQLSSSAVE